MTFQLQRLSFVGFLLLSFIFVIYYTRSNDIYSLTDVAVDHFLQVKEKVFNDEKLLPYLFKAKKKPHYKGKTIFFLETHLEEKKSNVSLRARQACSVEAAALTHPDYDVFLIYFREVGFYNTTSLPLIDAITSYKNVHLRRMDIYDYTENTPLDSWMETGILFNSTSLLTHTSDILRILTLWRYTGTYLDLDVVLRKRVDSIGSNFACVQRDGLINSAISNLDSLLGRQIAEKIFKETIVSFDPQAWTENGPGILTKVVEKMCNTTDIYQMNREVCKGFSVLPPKVCFEIDYPEWRMFFDEENESEVMKRIDESFAVHFWNNLSGSKKLRTNSNAAYIKIAKQFCPKVLKAAGEFF